MRSPLEQVYAERTALTVSNVARSLPNDETQYLDIHIVPLKEETGEIFGASILFKDITDYHALRTELQRANQELETANEELQSSNEELETTNEELQSTNEELETINEELQSTNEELHTINDELRLRTTELDEVNAFLNSILASLRAGVVVVDLQFNILSWNDEAENLWGLRQDEVKGKSLFNLDIGLPVDQLRTPIRDCLSGKIDSHELLIDAINRRGRAIQCRINLNLLLGSNGERQGVIVLMEEVEQ